MKNVKLFLKILLFIILIWTIIFLVDYIRVKNEKLPIFCIKSESSRVADVGTIQYYGLGYKVIDFNRINGFDKIKIGTYFMDYEDFQSEFEEYENRIKKTSNTILLKTGFREEDAEEINVEIIKEANEIIDIIKSAEFTKDTCDGLNDYLMYINMSENEEYGIEIFEYDNVHITNIEKGEAKLDSTSSKIINDILNKYIENK